MAMTLSNRIEEWRSQLLDTSKRNRLISLNLGRELQTASIRSVSNRIGFSIEKRVPEDQSVHFIIPSFTIKDLL